MPQSIPHRTRSVDPLWIALMGLVAGIVFLWWSMGVAATAHGIAARNTHNAQRAQRAGEQLIAFAPPKLGANASQQVSALIDSALKQAGVEERSLRGQSIRSLGPLADTGVLRQQARIEIATVSLKQAGIIAGHIEHAALPIWIESSEVTAVAGDRWSLVLELDWLESAAK